MSRRTTRPIAVALAALALGSLMVSGATLARSDLSAAQAATARFHSLVQAGNADYGAFPAGVPLHECISNLKGPGAMGIHWVNFGLLDETLDPTLPEVLVYAPDKHGKLKLAALEYVIFQDAWYAHHPADSMPELFGQMFMVGDAARFQIPPFFALHVWLYQDNPSGMFASFNPNVSCGGGSALAPAGAATLAAATVPSRFACAVPKRTA